jgi:hypothetical protein
VDVEPVRTRIEECAQWLGNRLLDRDLLIVGYWTDWDYLNEVLEKSLGTVNPSRVIVVDICETASFEEKAPALYSVGQRATNGFWHVRASGDVFLRDLRVEFSKALIRRVLHSGRNPFEKQTGSAPHNDWLEPSSSDAEVLWRVRRDLEGANPNEPAKSKLPVEEPLLGMTILQLRAAGATPDGSYWNLHGRRVRVLRAANRPLYEVEAAFARETAPVVSPDFTIAVGAEPVRLLPNFARSGPNGSIARGAGGRWLSRAEAIDELNI